jgi:hypothetical protein
MSFAEFADIVTVVSGTMTILGIGGIVSWGFLSRGGNELAETIVMVMAYSIRMGVCGLLILPAYVAWDFIYEITLVFLLGSLSMANLYWQNEHPVKYLAAYLLSLSLVLPVYLTIAACVFRSSLKPLIQMGRALLGRRQK